MQYLVSLLALLLFGLTPLIPAEAASEPNCVNADPAGVVTAITGDFELSVDPQDPQQNLIFLSNVTRNSLPPQNVVVAQMDGTTGMIIAGSLTTVANNFQGNSDQNGPSWMETPNGQLGIIYTGAGGVHGVYRRAQPPAWNSFSYNYDDSPSLGSPSVLPATGPGEYPGNPVNPPGRASAYPEYFGPCTSLCFANYNGGLQTDVAVVLAQSGYVYSTATQSPNGNILYVSACDYSNSCGLYQAALNSALGWFNSFKPVATTVDGLTSLAASQHPVTGTTVIFGSDAAGTQVNVWQQPAAGGRFTLIATVPTAGGAVHFRAGASDTQVVLNYFIRSGASAGQYTIAVSANGSNLSVANSNMINPFASGSEFDWFPAAHKWATVYRPSTGHYTRCWVTP